MWLEGHFSQNTDYDVVAFTRFGILKRVWYEPVIIHPRNDGGMHIRSLARNEVLETGIKVDV